MYVCVYKLMEKNQNVFTQKMSIQKILFDLLDFYLDI
jgi:hypothetical protein